MLEKGGYGVGTGKIFKQHTFIQVVTDHISKIQKKGKFKADILLNILNKREFSYARQQFERLVAAHNKAISMSAKEREKIEDKAKKAYIAIKNQEIESSVGEKLLAELDKQFLSLSDNIMQMRLDLDEAESMRFRYKGRDKEMLKAAQQKLLIERVTKDEIKQKKTRIIGELENQ